MNERAIESTELNKILSLVSAYAVLGGSKSRLATLRPVSKLIEAQKRLQLTEECVALLFEKGVSQIEYFDNADEEIFLAKKGSTLTPAALLKTAQLLRSTRIARTTVLALMDEGMTEIKSLVDRLYYDEYLEEDITTKIINDTEVSDRASDKLYSLRREIRLLNERIRSKLSDYLTGADGKYLQDGIVTVRNDRYVLPVKAEYKRNIKGFIHDKSQTGATFFIEPEEVLEMNNELRVLMLDEKEEVERILKDLSRRVGERYDELVADIETLEEIDCAYAMAQYAYKLACVKPEINEKGIIDIDAGRHPLIPREKVVPVSLSLGKNYRYLLISGPNTGGKTVTLKMVVLFSVMSMCGLFVPAKKAVLSVFDEIYCDVGDLQSIEESLSTFSSHITNVISIVNNANSKSLVLIDELGGGTDPEEGQALAKAIVSHLIKTGSTGVVTTHYTGLKEFAFSEKGIENACMEFDSNTLQPLYIIKIGLPGSSNALAISRRLGLNEDILNDALSNLSEDGRKFENIVRSAEESRIKAEETLKESNALKVEWQQKLSALQTEKEKLSKEREKLQAGARAETRRIVNERTAKAEEILSSIEEIFAKESLSQADLIKARTLKNKLGDIAYETENIDEVKTQYLPVSQKDLTVGKAVVIKSTLQEGVVQSVRPQKEEAEVLCGSIRMRIKFSDLALVIRPQKTQTNKKKAVQVQKSLKPKPAPSLELNIIGYTVLDAIPEVQAFLDSAVLSNLEEVRIVHGMGTGKLRAGVHEYLKKDTRVAEFRLGKYGEGDTGVTIVKLK